MNIKLFTPHLGQKAVIDGFADSEHKFGIVATGRQYGKSLLGQNLMLYWLLSSSKQKGSWVSPIYNQAKKVFQELSDASHQIITHSNKADLTITFVNGSTLQFLSAERYDSIRGFSFNYMVIDEAAFIKEGAINEAIFPTLSAIGRKCLIISTPKSKNWFYNAYLKGFNEDSDYISFRGISTDNPYVDAEFIEQQKLSLPPEIFKQEYLAEFTDAGSDVFTNVDNVCILNEFTEQTRGIRYYCGIDLGLAKDYSVLTIVSEDGRVVFMDRTNQSSYQEITRRFLQAIKRYSITGGFVEVNGPGRPVFEMLNQGERKLKPFTTTNESKNTGIKALIHAIQSGELMLPSKELFPTLYNELNAYSYKISSTGLVTFNAPNGFHDDTVMSLMLANEARTKLMLNKSSIYVGGSVDKKQYTPYFG